jgi:hypothetical protein
MKNERFVWFCSSAGWERETQERVIIAGLKK